MATTNVAAESFSALMTSFRKDLALFQTMANCTADAALVFSKTSFLCSLEEAFPFYELTECAKSDLPLQERLSKFGFMSLAGKKTLRLVTPEDSAYQCLHEFTKRAIGLRDLQEAGGASLWMERELQYLSSSIEGAVEELNLAFRPLFLVRLKACLDSCTRARATFGKIEQVPVAVKATFTEVSQMVRSELPSLASHRIQIPIMCEKTDQMLREFK